MEKEIKNIKYHLPLLLLIPLAWIVLLFVGKSELDFQLQASSFMVAKFHVAILFTLLLGVKAFLYYSTRNFPLSPPLCKFDVGLTCLLGFILLYYIGFDYVGSGLSSNAKALLSLGIGTWMMMQFFMGLNYFLVMFTQAKGNGESLF